jgi:ABC-type multidrug transport system permease subunit
MIDERFSGVWHRALVAGVRPWQFLVSHLVEGASLASINFVIYAVFALSFLLPDLSLNASVLLLLIVFLSGLAGTVFGVLTSVICNSVSASQYVNQAFINPATFICGKNS